MSDAPTVADRILGMLAAHTSKQPARDADLLARVGGDETEFWTAIEALKASRQINVAHIKRASDPAAWLAIWPTGARVGMDPWKTLNANGHFSPRRTHTPRHFPQSPAERREQEEKQMKGRTTERADDRRKAIAELVAGKPIAEGYRIKQVAAELHISNQAVDYLVKSMADGNQVARGRLPGEGSDRIYDPKAGQTSLQRPTPAAAPDVDGQAKGVADPEPIEFALWDDGRLSIYDGGLLVQLASRDTARLARLLGVPGAQHAAHEVRA